VRAHLCGAFRCHRASIHQNHSITTKLVDKRHFKASTIIMMLFAACVRVFCVGLRVFVCVRALHINTRCGAGVCVCCECYVCARVDLSNFSLSLSLSVCLSACLSYYLSPSVCLSVRAIGLCGSCAQAVHTHVDLSSMEPLRSLVSLHSAVISLPSGASSEARFELAQVLCVCVCACVCVVWACVCVRAYHSDITTTTGTKPFMVCCSPHHTRTHTHTHTHARSRVAEPHPRLLTYPREGRVSEGSTYNARPRARTHTKLHQPLQP